MPLPVSTLHFDSLYPPAGIVIPLAANALLTTQWQKVRLEPVTSEPPVRLFRLRGIILSDVNSFTPHFWVEFSEDGVNVAMSPGSVAIVSNLPLAVDVLCLGQYVRVNYQNGTTAQTLFVMRLYLEGANA